MIVIISDDSNNYGYCKTENYPSYFSDPQINPHCGLEWINDCFRASIQTELYERRDYSCDTLSQFKDFTIDGSNPKDKCPVYR